MIQKRLDPPFKGFSIGDYVKIKEPKFDREKHIILVINKIDKKKDRVGLSIIDETRSWFYLGFEDIRKLTVEELEKLVNEGS